MSRTVEIPKIFISYRRSDASANAGRLFDWLGHQFGRAQVFLDTDKIQAGAEFPDVLAESLADCDILLVVMGPQWLSTADEDGRRLDQSQDFVRREIETALAGGKSVIPVLVQDTKMPAKDDLPQSIQDLAVRNAVQLGDASFERDFDVLIDDILGRPRGFIRREFDRLHRMVLVASHSAVIIPLIAVIFALACFMKVFDFFSLDTRAASYLMRTADSLSSSPPESNVLLVTIDAESEKKLQPFDAENRALWRKNHAKLIDRAVAAGAEAVVFDLFLEKESAEDNKLAEAVRNATSTQTRIVFGINRYEQRRPILLDSLLQAGVGWGSTCGVNRNMGHLFMIPLFVRDQEHEAHSEVLSDNHKIPGHIPALALSASRSDIPDAIDLSRREILFEGSSSIRPVEYSTFERVNWSPSRCKALEYGDEVAMMLLRVPGFGYWKDDSRHLSYADFFEPGLVKDEQLRGRIILVGYTANTDGRNPDIHAVTGIFSSPRIFGVEFQASAIADLKAERVIKTPTIDMQILIVGMMALLGAGTSFFTATHTRGWRRMAFITVVVVYIAVAVLSALGGLLLNILYDLAAFFVAHKLLRWVQKRALRNTQPELE